MASEKKKSKRESRGLFWLLDMMTAFIYSLFADGGITRRVLGDNSFYENSVCNSVLEKNARSTKRNGFSRTLEWLVEKSVPLQAISAIRSFLFRMSLNSYGVFSVVFGLTSLFAYFTPLILGGVSIHDFSAVLTAAVIILCSLPMLMSQRSVASYVSESRVLHGIATSFLGIPKEKLKAGKKISGKGYVLSAAALGLICGGLTYFWHPSYMPIAMGIVIAVCLISANPESGVLMTLTALPFLQYTDKAEPLLLALVITTAISYVSKLLRHRRIITFTAESVTVLVFCGFILVAGLFTAGGARTVLDTVVAVIIILGGFFTTYNLMRGDRLLSSCLRIIAVTFSILAIVGVWNVFYDAVVDGVIYSMSDFVQPIIEGHNIYIADSTEVFSVFAVIAFPLIFSELAKKKSVSGVVLHLSFIALLVVAVFIYGTYETVVAIIVEFCLFWLLYSHKTLNAVIIALIPLGILAAIYPYIAVYFDIESIGEEIRRLLPLGFPDAAKLPEVVNSTLVMLFDGNISGIGVGQHAYVSAMAGYGDAVSIGADSPATFWLQVLCWSGLGGTITFLIFLVLIFKNGVGYLATSYEKDLRSMTLALFCGLATLLAFGGVNCIWNDMRTLYLFWAAMGLFVGYVQAGRGRERKAFAELSTKSYHHDNET